MVDPAESIIKVGLPLPNVYWRSVSTSVEDIVDSDYRGGIGDFYLMSWLFMHYLTIDTVDKPERLQQFATICAVTTRAKIDENLLAQLEARRVHEHQRSGLTALVRIAETAASLDEAKVSGGQRMFLALEHERDLAADDEVVLVRATRPRFLVPNAWPNLDESDRRANGAASRVVEDPQAVEVEWGNRFATDYHSDLALFTNRERAHGRRAPQVLRRRLDRIPERP